MKKLNYSVHIAAPVHTVWSTMLEADTYRQWAGSFNPTSRFEGDWQLGSIIRFVGANADGSTGGLVGRIVENRPDEFVSVQYFGVVENGVDDTESEMAKQFAGTFESYSFHEFDGVTVLGVEQDSADEFAAMFEEEWPKALAVLKQLAEARG
jgi:uncharacterized protein YndB with AHSA1/START domain